MLQGTDVFLHPGSHGLDCFTITSLHVRLYVISNCIWMAILSPHNVVSMVAGEYPGTVPYNCKFLSVIIVPGFTIPPDTARGVAPGLVMLVMPAIQ